jgi:hypothetical protein
MSRTEPCQPKVNGRRAQKSHITGRTGTHIHENQLEVLWEDLLSRQPDRVRAAFAKLDAPEQQVVLTHLQRMVSERGWQPEQRISAQAALKALKKQSDKE